MLFEDEKDFLDNNAELQVDDDGTVSWEDVLADDDDEIVSIKNKQSGAKSSAKQSRQEDSSDEIEFVDDSSDDADESQLQDILKNGDNQSQDSYSPDEDFDIDSQLANVVNEQNRASNDDVVYPRRGEQKKAQSSNPVGLLLFVVLVVAVIGGIYYGVQNFMGSKGMNSNQLAVPQTKVDEMNNVDANEIAQRNEENIPVVNEEQAGDVQADEDALDSQEETAAQGEQVAAKKQVIDVKPEGRDNPFLPTAKYMTSTVPVAKIDYDASGVPKPPEKFGVKEDTMKLMSIAVSGIMYDDVKPSAIITFEDNDYFVQKGDMLDDFKVVDIGRNAVAIALGSNIYRANIGEEFKITNIAGSAKYTSGGTRQYSTVNKEGSSVVSDARRYVSENDILINTK